MSAEPTAPTVRTFAPDEWRTYRRLRLNALADAPDAFGRTLAEEQARRDEEWQARLAASIDRRWHFPLVAEAGDEPVGLAWGRIEASSPHVASLYQVWVAPEYRGQGVGWRLVQGVIGWARQTGALLLALDVTCGDTPARRLYERAGFQPVGEPQPLRVGSALTEQPMVLALKKSIA